MKKSLMSLEAFVSPKKMRTSMLIFEQEINLKIWWELHRLQLSYNYETIYLRFYIEVESELHVFRNLIGLLAV